MKITDLVPSSCPKCGADLEKATALIGEAASAVLDWTVCVCCGEILRFTSIMTTRTATATEFLELDTPMQCLLAKISIFAKLASQRRAQPEEEKC